MLSFLLGLFPSIFTTINGITSAISNAKITQINATSAEEQAHIQATIDQLQSQRDVLIADASISKLDIYIRSLIAMGPTVLLLKVFIYDKVLQDYTHGTTELANSDYLWNVVMVVLGFYFVSSISTNVAKILKA